MWNGLVDSVISTILWLSAAAVAAIPLVMFWNGALVKAVTFANPIGWYEAWGILVIINIIAEIVALNLRIKKDLDNVSS